ncbi:MAG: hypothetical protein ACEQSC_01000 [Candidatus Nanopelagicaceae bacterium]
MPPMGVSPAAIAPKSAPPAPVNVEKKLSILLPLSPQPSDQNPKADRDVHRSSAGQDN